MQFFSNYNYFDGNHIKRNQSITIKNGKIISINTVDTNEHNDTFIVPGFIDLQIYGAAGKLFSAQPSLENIIHIEDELLNQGTTGFLICLATNTPEVFNQCIDVVKTHRKYSRNCLGLHLEGPFINPKKRGAHVSKYIRKASLDEIKKLVDFADGTVKMITLAPELQDDEIIEYLLDHGIVISLGHSDATFDEATRAYNNGIQTTTHLFNAMSPILHRQPGIPTAVFNHNKAMASIIADGHHVDFEVVKLAQKLMNDRLFLITDAVTECHEGPYRHHLINGKFVMPDGTLSGSALTMLQAIKNCVDYCEIDLPTAINMATYYPAKLIQKESSIGSIALGAQANLVILDKKLALEKVFFRGEEIKRDKASAI
ncbi:N-acetylglucosamine-6-phosphate deacetylase [Pedobacter sp. ASV28]|uniref:N-acetylglucosamine-6-phosphate deacetylase n=1 Tax=Pedobacter sp. ASV28 TaxID=2795123 RepID=UPI0018EB5EF4|nr:N-acetylglucosamine-6-phosphate deacetylase [Pedobacter sp. ASV28]